MQLSIVKLPAGHASHGHRQQWQRPSLHGNRLRLARTPASAARQDSAQQQQEEEEDEEQQPLQVATTAVAAISRGFCAALVSLLLAGAAPLPSNAVLELPRAQLPRTAEIALRRSVPAFNPDVKEIQDRLEDIALKLRIPQRKPWGGMSQSLAAATEVADNERALMAGVLPPNTEQAQQLIANIKKGLARLSDAVAAKDPDRTSLRVAALLREVGELELLQAPGLPYNLPRQYADLPRLTGRAVVEVTVKRQPGDDPPLDESQRIAKLNIVLDGYSAPITAGNFVANVLDGVYNGMRINTSYNSILVGQQGPGDRAIPLEMLAVGDFEPHYRTPLDVQSGELPVLPLSINGAVAMAQLADDSSDAGNGGNGGGGGGSRSGGLVSSRQFFIYKFVRSQAGLAGLSFDEGLFGVAGYVTEGADLLNRLSDGDTVVSAKVISGADKLVRPAAAVAAAAAAPTGTSGAANGSSG